VAKVAKPSLFQLPSNNLHMACYQEAISAIESVNPTAKAIFSQTFKIKNPTQLALSSAQIKRDFPPTCSL